MSHKRRDTLRIEEYCRLTGLGKKYLKELADAAMENYQRKWLPVMLIEWTPDRLPNLKRYIGILADADQVYSMEEKEEAIRFLSRMRMLDVFVEGAVQYVREELLMSADPSYDIILESMLNSHGRENSIATMGKAGVSRSVYFERKSELLTALGLALIFYSAQEAVNALGEW